MATVKDLLGAMIGKINDNSAAIEAGSSGDSTANAIPVYKKEDITTEMAVNFAKNKAVLYIEKTDDNLGSVGSTTKYACYAKYLIAAYKCTKSYYGEGTCGDEEYFPAKLAFCIADNYYAKENETVCSFEITDEIINEIKAAWGL